MNLLKDSDMVNPIKYKLYYQHCIRCCGVDASNCQVIVTSFGCCWYGGGIPYRSEIKAEQFTWY